MPKSKNKKKSRKSSSNSNSSDSRSNSQNKSSNQKNKNMNKNIKIQNKQNKSRSRSKSQSNTDHKRVFKKRYSSSKSRSSSSKSSKDFNKDKYVSHHHQKKFRNIVENMHKFADVNKNIIQDQFQYTAESNPFADKELHKPFIWKKQLETKEEEINVDYLHQKRMQQVQEIQKQRELRKIRELEKEKLEEDKIRFAQDRQDDTYEQWVEKQKKFQFEQEQRRAFERIKQGRPIWVDYFYQVVKIMKAEQQYNPHFDKFMKYPQEILMWLNQSDLEQLFEQAKAQKIFEEDEKYKKYWDCIISIVQYLIEETQEGQAQDKKQKKFNEQQEFKNPMLQYNHNDRSIDKEALRRTIIKKEYDEDIYNMISDKNLEELENLKKEILETQTNNDFKLDMEFWNCVQKRIDQKIAWLDLQQFQKEYYKNKQSTDQKYDIYQKTHKALESDDEFEEEYEKGQHSPLLLEFKEGILCITEEEDLRNLHKQREQIFKKELSKLLENIKLEKEKKQKMKEEDLKKQKQQTTNSMSSITFSEITNDREIAEQIRNFEKNQPKQKDEEKFDDAIKLVKNYNWIDKFQPKKPQYFNRVKTGFFWNVYYRTHYDQDNPPPKVIQGYKFNIFYPELIDKNSTPTYELQPTEDPEYCLIIFKGGPPYEDIAFKIINKEWDFSDKKGFKCLFARGILHLYFNFKVYRSRR